MKVFLQKFAKILTLGFTIIFTVHSPNAQAYEEAVIVTTGLGIASPSFHDGLSGENPAGMAANTSSKISAEVRADNHSFKSPKPAAGVLIGNGYFGAGLELERTTTSQVNWGFAGRIAPIGTTLGVSGHHTVPGTKGSYDAGMNLEMGRTLQMGLAAFSISRGVDSAGVGFLWDADAKLSFVLDAIRGIQNAAMLIAPGFAINMNKAWVFSASYAYQMTDQAVPGKHSGIRAGLGVRIIQSILFKYEYNDQALHNLGLSVRF